MSTVWTVARRELRGYLDQATAYVLVVAFLGLSLYLTFRTMYASGLASLRPLFDLLPILFAVFVPAATMRTLAEERRGHTLEWLMAQPVHEAQVVLGKFLGDWLFVLAALAGTLPTAIGILLVSEADPGIVVAQYIGAALLAGQFVAIGLWASSFTRNQITAFIVAAVVSFTLFLIGLPVVQIGLPPLLSGALARLSVVSHFENVARGVIDLRDVLYFVSTGALFVVLAIGAISRDRLSHTRAEYRRLRLGAGVFALLVIMVNLLGSYVRGRLDLTSENLYTLAPGTRQIVRDLDDLVQVKLFASSQLPPEIQLQLRDVRDLLADVRRASGGNLVVEELNPDEDDEAASQASSFGIYPVEFNVLRDDEFQVRRGYYGMAIQYAGEREVFPLIERTDDLEFRIASAISKMTTEERPRVAFVQGFGGKGPFEIPGLQESLGERYTLRSIEVAGDSAAPIPRDSTEVLVVAGPTQALDSAAVRRVGDYVRSGGAALFLLEPVQLNQQSPMPMPVRTGLESLLAEQGIGYSPRLAFDLASNERVSLGQRGMFNVIAPYPLWPVAMPATRHPVTRSLNSVTFAWVAPLEITDSTAVTALWQTTEAGGVRTASQPIYPDQDWNVPEEELARRTLAVAVDRASAGEDGEANGAASQAAPAGRMIVVGDASFTDQQFARANPANITFVANAIDWLAQDEALMSIRSKVRTPPALAFTSDAGRNLLKWGSLVGIPLLFALVGVLRVTGRRRRAELKWKEVVA